MGPSPIPPSPNRPPPIRAGSAPTRALPFLAMWRRGARRKATSRSDDWLASCVRRCRTTPRASVSPGPGEMERRAAEESEAVEPRPVVAALVLLAALGVPGARRHRAIAATLAGRV